MSGDDSNKDMKKAFPVFRRPKKNTGKDVEQIDLDVTPVMNLFMVLIPFLVSMAVFTHLAVIDFSLPSSTQAGEGDETAQEERTDLDISLVVTSSGFRIVGTGDKLDLVPRVRGEYQFDQLRAILRAIKFQYPSQTSIILVLEEDIIYNDIIKFMDICREAQFPDISLSGDVG
ncbi:biopolymer transport protein ExbD [Chitinispirillum alkaliphilum]|nr:biopolymer transport protein ExbD [Chitinispirillum alkaliphilum]